MSYLLSQNRRPVHLFSVKAPFTSRRSSGHCIDTCPLLDSALRAQTVCYYSQLYPMDLAQCLARSRSSICIFKRNKTKQNSNSHRVRRVIENTGWPHTRIQWVSSSNLWRSWQTFSIRGQRVSIHRLCGFWQSYSALLLYHRSSPGSPVAKNMLPMQGLISAWGIRSYMLQLRPGIAK